MFHQDHECEKASETETLCASCLGGATRVWGMLQGEIISVSFRSGSQGCSKALTVYLAVEMCFDLELFARGCQGVLQPFAHKSFGNVESQRRT